MIVACEGCQTRFRLDESKLPASGARVRCSRCKHCFFLKPPAAAEEDVLEELAREAAVQASANAAQPATPEAAEPDERLAAPEESESDWEFNADFGAPDEAAAAAPSRTDPLPAPPPAPEVSRTPPAGPSSAAPAITAPASRAEELLDSLLDGDETLDDDDAGSPLDELGDPTSWDLVGPGLARSEVPAPPVPEPRLPGEVVEPVPDSRTVAPELGREEDGAPALAPEEPVEPVRVVRRSGTAWQAVGWAATALLLAAGVLGLARSAAPPVPRLDPIPLVPGMTLEAVRARSVENALAGPVLVISGRVRNGETRWRGVESGLVVRLLDERGEPIPGAEATAGRPIPERRLREDDPRELRALHGRDQRRFATRAVAPGLTVPFDAVFESVPRAAAAFRVDPTRLPAPEPEPEPTESPSPP